MKAPIFSFEKLKVWQKARSFHREVFRLTTKFPLRTELCIDTTNKTCCPVCTI